MSKNMARDEQERKIIKIMQDSSSYRDIALRGEPCPVFPGLSADSANEDIERAIAAQYESRKRQLAETRPDLTAAEESPEAEYVVKGILRMYADEYVKGARERRSMAEGVAV